LKLSPADKLSLYTRAGNNALGLFGRKTYPPAIIWVLTQRCFYECVHCDSWMDETPIDAEALLGIADKIAASSTKIVALSGGEPFMVKSLPTIAAKLKRAGKIVSINTNGHLLEEHADWLIAEAVDHVQVSIDGHDAELHDAIRRRPGSFEKIVRGIEALKTKRRQATPQISVCSVLMKENAAHLVEFVDRFADVADSIEIQPLHESPGLLATSASAGFSPADASLVREQLASLIERHPAFANDFYRNFPRFLFAPQSMREFAVDHCLPMIFNTLTIREDGACRICRYPLHQNIHATSLFDIWNSTARWELYQSLITAGCAEPCWIRCHIHPSPLPGKLLKKGMALLG
jgi:MoaA/NifB/PqqE/SkfB family radical SAM enzyme